MKRSYYIYIYEQFCVFMLHLTMTSLLENTKTWWLHLYIGFGHWFAIYIKVWTHYRFKLTHVFCYCNQKCLFGWKRLRYLHKNLPWN